MADEASESVLRLPGDSHDPTAARLRFWRRLLDTALAFRTLAGRIDKRSCGSAKRRDSVDFNGTLVCLVFAWSAARAGRLLRRNHAITGWLNRAIGTLFFALGARLAFSSQR